MNIRLLDILHNSEVREPIAFQGVHIAPLIGPSSRSRAYLTLAEAYAKEGVAIGESSNSGTVAELLMTNRLDADVLLIDGEELVGARQNRVLNATALVGPHATVMLPVSCVERGRWHYDTRAMALSGNLEFAASRARKVASVSGSLRKTGTYGSAQHEVWESVDQVLGDLGSRSRTSAMREAYVARADELADYVEAFPPQVGQTGALVAVRGRWVAMEWFSHPDVYAHFAPQLIRSHAAQVIGRSAAATVRAPAMSAAEAFESTLRVHGVTYAGIGKGETVRFQDKRWQGAALSFEEQVLHGVLFRHASTDRIAP